MINPLFRGLIGGTGDTDGNLKLDACTDSFFTAVRSSTFNPIAAFFAAAALESNDVVVAGDCVLTFDSPSTFRIVLPDVVSIDNFSFFSFLAFFDADSLFSLIFLFFIGNDSFLDIGPPSNLLKARSSSIIAGIFIFADAFVETVVGGSIGL